MNEKKCIRNLSMASAIPTLGLLLLGFGSYGSVLADESGGGNCVGLFLVLMVLGILIFSAVLRLFELGSIRLIDVESRFNIKGGRLKAAWQLFVTYIIPQLIVLGCVMVLVLLLAPNQGWLILCFVLVGVVLLICSAVSVGLGVISLWRML